MDERTHRRPAARAATVVAALGLVAGWGAVSAGPAAAAPDVSVTLCHATAPSGYTSVTITAESYRDIERRISRDYPLGANPTDVIPAFEGFEGRSLSGGGQEFLATGCVGTARPADASFFICHWNPAEFFEPGSVIVSPIDGGYQMSWTFGINWNGHEVDANDIVPVVTDPTGQVLLPGRNLTPDTQAYLDRGCADPGAPPPPSPAPIPEVPQVTDVAAVPVAVPQAATVPIAVPSGAGSSAPSGVPLVPSAMLIAGALGAVLATRRLTSR